MTASFNIIQNYYLVRTLPFDVTFFTFFELRAHYSSCAKYHGDTRAGLAIIIGEVQTVAGGTSESVLGVQRPDPYLFILKAVISQYLQIRRCRKDKCCKTVL